MDKTKQAVTDPRTVAGVKQFGSPTGDYYPRMESEKYAIYDQFGHMIEGNFDSREKAVAAIDPDWINTIGAVWVNVHVNP